MPSQMESRLLPVRLGTVKVPVTDVNDSFEGALRDAPPLLKSKAAYALPNHKVVRILEIFMVANENYGARYVSRAWSKRTYKVTDVEMSLVRTTHVSMLLGLP